MFILYTVAPLLYRLASSTYYNISLLTSDFYGLLFGRPPQIISPSIYRTDHAVLFVQVSSSSYVNISLVFSVHVTDFTNFSKSYTALQPVLALLPCLRGRYRRSCCILLALNSYVRFLFSFISLANRCLLTTQLRNKANSTSMPLRT